MNIQPTYAAVMAFYGDPLPFERQGRSYLEAIVLAKIGALRALLGEDHAIRYDGPVSRPVAPSVASVAPKRKSAAKAKASATAIGAERFWQMHSEAVAACRAAFGPNWKCAAPIGETVLVSPAARYRSYRGPLGTVIKYRRDHRIPAARFWAGGVLPDGIVMSEDTPRETAPKGWGDPRKGVMSMEGYTAWVKAWARARGFLEHKGQYYTAAEYQRRVG